MERRALGIEAINSQQVISLLPHVHLAFSFKDDLLIFAISFDGDRDPSLMRQAVGCYSLSESAYGACHSEHQLPMLVDYDESNGQLNLSLAQRGWAKAMGLLPTSHELDDSGEYLPLDLQDNDKLRFVKFSAATLDGSVLGLDLRLSRFQDGGLRIFSGEVWLKGQVSHQKPHAFQGTVSLSEMGHLANKGPFYN
jgi:hypothetical protein